MSNRRRGARGSIGGLSTIVSKRARADDAMAHTQPLVGPFRIWKIMGALQPPSDDFWLARDNLVEGCDGRRHHCRALQV